MDNEKLQYTLLAAVFTAMLGLIIQLVLNFWRNWTEKNNSRLKFTSDLHQEFNTEAMSKIRNSASSIVEGNPSKRVSALLNHDEEIEDAGKIIPLLVVLRFYHRLALLQKEGALKNSLLLPWFGRTYVWWFRYYFERGFSQWGTVYDDLHDLYNWMEQETIRNSRPRRWFWRRRRYHVTTDTWRTWVRDGDQAYSNVLERFVKLET